MADNLSQGISDLALKIAQDQFKQEIEANAKFALKSDLGTTETIQQLIAFYNGYNGTALDYRDYLGNTTSAVQQALYALGNGYLGAGS